VITSPLVLFDEAVNPDRIALYLGIASESVVTEKLKLRLRIESSYRISNGPYAKPIPPSW
jgi:hypothetical protein